jgi:hypothetical protein
MESIKNMLKKKGKFGQKLFLKASRLFKMTFSWKIQPVSMEENVSPHIFCPFYYGKSIQYDESIS